MFGDALLCSAAIVYLGPFPPLRRQELLAKWLALCKGFQETLGPDDVAQALKQNQKPVIVPSKKPLLPTCSSFSLLSLLSSESEQFQWDRDLKPQAKSARLAALLLRSRTHYFNCRWPLVLDPNKQALMWLNPLPQEHARLLAPGPTEDRGNARDDDHSVSRASELPGTGATVIFLFIITFLWPRNPRFHQPIQIRSHLHLLAQIAMILNLCV